MRKLIGALVVAVGGMVVAQGQPKVDSTLDAQLRQLFPAATAFSAKEGDPPHFKAYLKDPRSGPSALAGFAF